MEDKVCLKFRTITNFLKVYISSSSLIWETKLMEYLARLISNLWPHFTIYFNIVNIVDIVSPRQKYELI